MGPSKAITPTPKLMGQPARDHDRQRRQHGVERPVHVFALASGTSTANSSPPMRATRSERRTPPMSVRAIRRKAVPDGGIARVVQALERRRRSSRARTGARIVERLVAARERVLERAPIGSLGQRIGPGALPLGRHADFEGLRRATSRTARRATRRSAA